MVQKLLLGPDGQLIMAKLEKTENIRSIAVQHELNPLRAFRLANGGYIMVEPENKEWEPVDRDKNLWRRK